MLIAIVIAVQTAIFINGGHSFNEKTGSLIEPFSLEAIGFDLLEDFSERYARHQPSAFGALLVWSDILYVFF